jgi:hypothetical protein
MLEAGFIIQSPFYFILTYPKHYITRYELYEFKKSSNSGKVKTWVSTQNLPINIVDKTLEREHF